MVMNISYSKLIFLLLVLLFSLPLQAITWHQQQLPTGEETQLSKLEFGDIRVTQEIKISGRPTIPPEYVLSIHKGEKLLARLPHVGVQFLTASNGHKLFVGVSNLTYPGTAIIIFDDRGRLLREIKHMSVALDYCEANPDLHKGVWYDPENSKVEFEYAADGETVVDVLINDCRGNRVSLPDIILKAYDDFVERVRNENK